MGSSIIIKEKRTIPHSTRQALRKFTRPSGDFDFVPTHHYLSLQKAVQDSYPRVSEEEYSRQREQYLWKGGGSIMYEELPEHARTAVHLRENRTSVMCDPLEVYGPHRFAKTTIEGTPFFIARPDAILAYKVLHLLQSYHMNPQKFNRDFPLLFEAVNGLHSLEELLETTHEVLVDYETASASNTSETQTQGMVTDLLSTDDLSETTRSFVTQIVEHDRANNAQLHL